MTKIIHLEHRDGIDWFNAPRPFRFHKHRWQTRAFLPEKGYWIERCACGATHYSDIPGWTKSER